MNGLQALRRGKRHRDRSFPVGELRNIDEGNGTSVYLQPFVCERHTGSPGEGTEVLAVLALDYVVDDRHESLPRRLLYFGAVRHSSDDYPNQ
jgi:hypothetical protein